MLFYVKYCEKTFASLNAQTKLFRSMQPLSKGDKDDSKNHHLILIHFIIACGLSFQNVNSRTSRFHWTNVMERPRALPNFPRVWRLRALDILDPFCMPFWVFACRNFFSYNFLKNHRPPSKTTCTNIFATKSRINTLTPYYRGGSERFRAMWCSTV